MDYGFVVIMLDLIKDRVFHCGANGFWQSDLASVVSPTV